MELTSKEEIMNEIFNKQVVEIQTKIERELKDKNYEKFDNYIQVIISGEYEKKAREIVEGNYCLEGWVYVEITGSSENDEHGGLSGVKLYYENTFK